MTETPTNATTAQLARRRGCLFYLYRVMRDSGLARIFGVPLARMLIPGVENSLHNIMFDDPKAVITAVQDVIQSAQSGQHLVSR